MARTLYSPACFGRGAEMIVNLACKVGAGGPVAIEGTSTGPAWKGGAGSPGSVLEGLDQAAEGRHAFGRKRLDRGVDGRCFASHARFGEAIAIGDDRLAA